MDTKFPNEELSKGFGVTGRMGETCFMIRPYAALFLLGFIAVSALHGGQPERKPEPPEGVLPVGAEGEPLNLDFETGTLKNGVAEGDAFAGQPIKGDTVHPRRSNMRSNHQGQ